MDKKKKKPTKTVTVRKVTKKGLGGNLSRRQKNRAAKGAVAQAGRTRTVRRTKK